MQSYVQRLFAESPIGIPVEVEAAGTPLENRWAYDSGARELHALALAGAVEIVEQQKRVIDGCDLITRVVFRRIA